MPGTYVGLRVDPISARKIREFCETHNIPMSSSEFEKRLHTTVVYSRVPFSMNANPLVVYPAKITEFGLFTNDVGENRVLVAKLNSPGVSRRHAEIRKLYGATHDYPTYMPHITLTYDYDPTTDISNLPVPDWTINLTNEYVEELKLHWAKNHAKENVA